MLVAGGVFMLFCDRIFNKGSENTQLTEKRAFMVGLFQCIAMIPGVSRSMATIVGGMAQKMTRKDAAEFSFFLAVPTMLGSTVYKIYKMLKEGGTELFFIRFVQKYGFQAFGWYRIIVGGIILALLFTGHELTIL